MKIAFRTLLILTVVSVAAFAAEEPASRTSPEKQPDRKDRPSVSAQRRAAEDRAAAHAY
jgi:hypothetical protein